VQQEELEHLMVWVQEEEELEHLVAWVQEEEELQQELSLQGLLLRAENQVAEEECQQETRGVEEKDLKR
jgi:hypothetical protein